MHYCQNISAIAINVVLQNTVFVTPFSIQQYSSHILIVYNIICILSIAQSVSGSVHILLFIK